jgi:hypothetical protein
VYRRPFSRHARNPAGSRTKACTPRLEAVPRRPPCGRRA